MLVNLVQFANAESPILDTPFAIVIFSKTLQFQNAEFPIIITLDGIVTFVSLWQSLNAALPISITSLGMSSTVVIIVLSIGFINLFNPSVPVNIIYLLPNSTFDLPVGVKKTSLTSVFDKLNNSEQQLQTELKQYSQKPKKKIHIAGSINTIMDANRKKMLYYDALSYGIPDNLWLEYFEIGSDDNVAMSGIAMNSSDITAFLKGIREVAGESDVALSKLTIINEEDILNYNGEDLYSFQLTKGTISSGEDTSASSAEQEKQQTKKATTRRRNSTPPANLPSLAPPVRIINN